MRYISFICERCQVALFFIVEVLRHFFVCLSLILLLLSRQQSEDEPFHVTLSDESFETYELDPPPYQLEVTKKQLKQMYKDMVVVRYERHMGFRRSVIFVLTQRYRIIDKWRWLPTDYTRRRRFGVSATSPPVRRPSPSVSSMRSTSRTMSSPLTDATVSPI